MQSVCSTRQYRHTGLGTPRERLSERASKRERQLAEQLELEEEEGGGGD